MRKGRMRDFPEPSSNFMVSITARPAQPNPGRGVCPMDDNTQIMSWGGKGPVLAMGIYLLGIATHVVTADVPDNTYGNIVVRNLFDLKPIPQITNELPTPPPPKITLTGITTILGKKQALLMEQVPARPPQKAQEQSYILAEGERDGDIEVVSIDEKAGSVRVINHGIAQELTFEKDGVKMPGTLVAMTGQPRGTQEPTPPPPQHPQPSQGFSLSPDEQAILIEVNRLQTGDQVKAGELPPLPPTDLTPLEMNPVVP